MVYEIEVKQQGSSIAHHIVEAVNALTAINLVESNYGEPVQYEIALIEDEHNHLHRMVVANNWHGYTFEARAIGPYTSGNMVNLQPEGYTVSARHLSLVQAHEVERRCPIACFSPKLGQRGSTSSGKVIAQRNPTRELGRTEWEESRKKACVC